ncbi:hypothetical protein V1511DRAFT_498373 [Dipodascopsis uninucleata]
MYHPMGAMPPRGIQVPPGALPVGVAPPPPGMGPAAAAKEGPAPKRQRTEGGFVGTGMGSSQQAILMALEDEDVVASVDELDSVSAREISASRYARHHEWMEQILGSAYASSKIEPPGEFWTKSKGSSVSNGDGIVGVYGTLKNMRERVIAAQAAVDEEIDRSQAESLDDKWRVLKGWKEAEKALADVNERENGSVVFGARDIDFNEVVRNAEAATGTKLGDRLDRVERVKWEE